MEQKSKKRIVVGRVTSSKMDKTIVVVVEMRVRHPLFNKVVRRRKKFVAHDEQNQCQVDDRVKIEESRPLSKTKRWMLVEILKKAEKA
jgi:small subunit ribosomal protein S17